MCKIISPIIIISSTYFILLLYFSLSAIGENDKKSFMLPLKIFAQENNLHDKFPIVKSSKIIELSGSNYGDVVNSSTLILNNFTVSVWFNTAMNVTGELDEVFLINKGGLGTDLIASNLNYGLWLNKRERIIGGFEALNGDDYFLSSKNSYANSKRHNAILTFDNEQNFLKLYIDGQEVATNSTNIGLTPDTMGKSPIRIGANAFDEKGKVSGNYTGKLDDIKIWDFAFTKEQVNSLFIQESKIER